MKDGAAPEPAMACRVARALGRDLDQAPRLSRRFEPGYAPPSPSPSSQPAPIGTTDHSTAQPTPILGQFLGVRTSKRVARLIPATPLRDSE